MEPIALSKVTTAERVAAEIRLQILDGRLPPGVPLREEELARVHGASRHVIRETLRLLVAEGLAEYSAFRGARVSYVSVEDVRDIYQARRFFELNALRNLPDQSVRALAQIHGQYAAAVDKAAWSDAFRLDAEFHGVIVAAADSRRMAAWHGELFKALSLAHHVRPEFREHGLRTSVSQHAEIVVALSAGDHERASQALIGHLTHAESLLTKRISEQEVEMRPRRRAAAKPHSS